MDGPQLEVKSFEIRKRFVYEAWMKVQANGGAPGVDAVSIDRFADKETDNLYELWNRMSSGSYFPGPVRAVEIPKDHVAGVRVLGVPNTLDRIAQTAAAMLLEEKLEPIFHRPSSTCAVAASTDFVVSSACLSAASATRFDALMVRIPTMAVDVVAATRTTFSHRSTWVVVQ
jgi:retron-type reverse transcriptase